ncbi:hypothetical protein [Devosia sp. A369]
MSRGFGVVQQRIIAVYEQQPQGSWTVEQLAAMVYPGAALGRAHKESVRRALAKLGEPLQLHRCRVRLPSGAGWHHVIARAN